jgi:hypothetical protein
MNRPKSLAAVALTVLFLAACSSGGIGDILGGGGGSGQASNYEIRGVVDRVDTASRSVYLTNVSGYTSMLSSGGSGNTVRVYYDNQTQVRYGGQTYQVSDLERGDEVAVNVAESGNNLVADVVTVTRDASSGSSYPSSSIGSMLRGSVRYIDTSRRTIEVDRGTGSTVIVEYGSNTPVYFNGRNYMVADLERGDEIEINITDLGSGRYSARDITVTRSVSGTTSGSTSASGSTIRGTVAFIDTSRRTIELESTSWGSRFNSTSGNRVTISYDQGLNIDVNGRMQPISGLERGDVIEVQVNNTTGNVLYANRMWLVRDVNNF